MFELAMICTDLRFWNGIHKSSGLLDLGRCSVDGQHTAGLDEDGILKGKAHCIVRLPRK